MRGSRIGFAHTTSPPHAKGAGDGRASAENAAEQAVLFAIDTEDRPADWARSYLARQARIAADLAAGHSVYGPDYWQAHEKRMAELLDTLEPGAGRLDLEALAEELGIDRERVR